MKLSVNEAKLTGFWARNCATIQQVLILKFAFGPVKLSGLSRNGPQAFGVVEVRTSGLVSLVMVATGQEMVRGTKNSPRSGKSREFQFKSGKS